MTKKFIGFLVLMVLLLTATAVSATDASDNTTTISNNIDTTTTTDVEQEYSIINEPNTITDEQIESETSNMDIEEDDYTFANETLDITGNNYDGHTLTLLDNVNVLSSNNMQLTGTAFVVNGNNVNITGLTIVNNNFNTVAITVTGSDVNIIGNNITVNKSESGQTKAIVINGTENVEVSDNTIIVSGVPQEDEWISITSTPSHSVDIPKVDGIEVWNSTNIRIVTNNITITNSSTPTGNATAKAIVINNNTSYSTVSENNITISGFEYIHAISLCYKINRVNVTYNSIELTGINYINGINLLYVTNSNLLYNNITGECFNITQNPVSGESLAYGINLLTEDTIFADVETIGNTVNHNNINLNSTITYGVELCLTTYNEISYNNMSLNGTVVVGIGMIMSESNNMEYNTIKVKSDYKDLAEVYELIPPTFTTGVYIYLESYDNYVNYNKILIEESADSGIYTVVIECDDNDVSENYLTSISDTTLTGDDAVLDEGVDNYVGENEAYPTYSLQNTPISPIKTQLKKKVISNPKSATNNEIIITPNSFDNYVTDGVFNENVHTGDSIIFDGKFDGERFSLTVNKAVNITSTPKTIFNLYTTTGSTPTSWNGGIFQIIESGSNTNISNLNFENTRIIIAEAKNVVVDNISVFNGFAQNMGQFSIRNQSDNITVKNSYFKTFNNGGSSNFVIAGAKNSLIENNTIVGEGHVGNIFYLCPYFSTIAENGFFNNNLTIKDNLIKAINSESDICYGIVVEGKNVTFENNTVLHNKKAVCTYSGKAQDITFINNYVPYGTVSPASLDTLINNTMNEVYSTDNALIENNSINILHTANNTLVRNNIINQLDVNSNNIVEENILNTVNISGDNVIFNENTVNSLDKNYSVNIISGNGINITNNEITNNLTYGDNAITGTANLIENNTGYPFITITDDNYEEYGTLTILKKKYNYDIPSLPDCYLNIKSQQFTTVSIAGDFENTSTIFLINLSKNDLPNLGTIEGNFVKLNVLNSYIPDTTIRNQKTYTYNIINSTVKRTTISTISPGAFNIDENSKVIADIIQLESNLDNNGYLKGNNYPSIVYVTDFQKCDVFINKQINLTNWGEGNINNTVTFISGSEESNITGIIFNEKVYINTSNITFTNCIFMKGIVLNNSTGIVIENSVITTNEEETPIQFENSSDNQVINNNITSLNGITISFSSDSINNTVKNNLLNATTKYNVESVTGRDNNSFEENGILYDVSINIDVSDTFYLGESVPLNVTVTDKFNNKLVENGYVEIYADGLPQATLNLTEGKATTDITVLRALKTRIKVWYYPTEKYDTTTQTKMVTVKESTGNIVIDEISGTKIGDEISINTRINSTDVIDEGNISFQFSDNSISVPVVNNRANLTTTITTAMMDNPSLRLVFETDKAKYNIKSTTTTLTIEPGITNIMVDPVNGKINDEVTLTAHVTDNNNEIINDGEIIFTNDNGDILATAIVVDGIATAPYTFTSEYDGKVIATINSTYRQDSSAENTINIRKINTFLNINTTSTNITTGETIIISGTLIDEDDNILSYKDIELNINVLSYDLISNDKGIFSLPYSPTIGGTLDISAKYDGDEIYNTTTSNTLEITVTDLVAEQLENLTQQNEELKEQLNNLTQQNEELKDKLDNLTQQNEDLKEQLENLTQLSNELKEQLNNQTSELSQQNDALQNQINTLNTVINTLTNVINNQNEQISALSDLINNQNEQIVALTDLVNEQNEQISALTAPENTTIVLDTINDVKYDSNVTISGSLVSQKGIALSGQTITITIDGEEPVNVITDNGAFEYTTAFKSVGEKTVTVRYGGNDYYVESEDSVTFTVEKQDTSITVEGIADVKKGETVTITGTLTDNNGKSLSNKVVRLLINNGRKTLKTDVNGVYTFDYTLTRIGENTIKATFEGNDYYTEATTILTVDVKSLATKITLDPMGPVIKGKQATISGTLTDENNNTIANAQVKITINGSTKTLKTDSEGRFTHTYTFGKIGQNTITTTYTGSNSYDESEAITTVDVEKAKATITLTPIEKTAKDSNVTITGSLTDTQDNAIANAQVRITVNNSPKTLRTDENGLFTYVYTMKNIGTNNITAIFNGNNNFEAIETFTTAEVIKID